MPFVLLHLLQGLQRRQDAAAARATLELMQEVAASTGKVEKLLEEVAAAAAQQPGSDAQQQIVQAAAASVDDSDGAAAAGGDGELTSRCRLLVRAAGEASRLLFLVERGKVRPQQLTCWVMLLFCHDSWIHNAGLEQLLRMMQA